MNENFGQHVGQLRLSVCLYVCVSVRSAQVTVHEQSSPNFTRQSEEDLFRFLRSRD